MASYDESSYYKWDQKHPVFSSGIVDNVQPNLLADSESPYIRNGRLDGCGIKKRPGRRLLSTTDGTNIGGIQYFNRPSGGNNALIVRSDIDSTHKLASIDENTGVVTQINTGANISGENYMNFTQGGDKIFCLDGQDGIGEYDGTDYTQKVITLSIPNTTVDHFSFGAGGGSGSVSGNAVCTASTANINIGSSVLNVNDTIFFYQSLGNIQANKLYKVSGISGTNPNNLITIVTYPVNIGSVVPDSSGTIGFLKTNVSQVYSTYITSLDSSGNPVANTLKVGNPVQFINNGTATDYSHQNLPAPLSSSTTYYVKQIINADIFTVSATPSGSAISFTNYGTPIDTVNAKIQFSPSFSCIFNGSHWAAGDRVYSNTLLKSVGGTFNDFSSSGSDTFSTNEPITGLGVTSESLFIFTRKSCLTTGPNDITTTGGKQVYYQRPTQAYEGAVNHQSIVAAGIVIYFLTPSNKIQMMLRGRSVVFGYETHDLTHRKYRGIENFMNSLPKNQTQAVGYYDSKKQIIKWFLRDFNAPAGVNNICVVYDTNKDAFFIDTNVISIGACYSNDQGFVVSPYDGNIYQDEIGRNDDDAPIHFFYKSKVFDSGSPSMLKEYWESRTYIQANENVDLEQKLYIDNVVINTKNVSNPTNIRSSDSGIGTKATGTFAIGRDESYENIENLSIIVSKGNLRKRGRNIYFTWEDNALNSTVLLESLQIKSLILPPQTFNFSD